MEPRTANAAARAGPKPFSFQLSHQAIKRNEHVKLAFLGLGQMGAAIAAKLLDSGYDVTVWNRSKAATESLLKQGAKAASTPAEAVREANAVLTC